MADKSAIEWTDATWTVVTGCSKVSPGCAHCYAEKLGTTRLAGRHGYTALPWTPENAAANVVLHPERLSQPLRWRAPRRIFVTSMGDLFHEQVPDDFIDQVFAVMAETPRHTFQLLTKRPERMRAYIADEVRWHTVLDQVARLRASRPSRIRVGEPKSAWPLPNVWIGTSVENQTWADRRIPDLLATPAAVRFLSCEPLLGPVNLARHVRRVEVVGDDGEVHYRVPVDHDIVVRQIPELLRRRPDTGYHTRPDVEGDHLFHPGPFVDWVIAGGESGPEHRPVDPAWVRSLRDQCQAAGVPFLFKQWGGRTPKSGGRELDGRTWDGYPEATA